MIYYTSDQHFCHNNIIKLCNRHFNNILDMDFQLESLWNRKVRPEDTVYILGDLFFKQGNIEDVKSILNHLHSKKILIKGNHDNFLNQINWRDYFDKVCDYLKIKYNGRDVILCHYPIEEWDGFFRGSYHLYGHVHNNDNGLRKFKRRYNVGVDVNDFEPKTLDELINKENIKND